jgi:hypothetical protein
MSEHWHVLIGSHLDREAVQLDATPALDTAEEARKVLLDGVATICADAPPLYAGLIAEHIASMPAENCHALFGSAGFTVTSCSGGSEDACIQRLDREADEMIGAYNTKQMAKGLFIEQIVNGIMAGMADRPDDEPGGYL